MAIALAARTFSCKEDEPEVLLVRECHVQYVYDYLKRTYDDSVFGYRDFSRAQDYANRVIDPGLIKKRILDTKYPRDLIEHLLHADEVTMIDISDWCEMDREESSRLLSFLVRKHALYRVKRWYVKTSEFISLLKELSEQKIEQRPEGHRKERF
jgi:hypothetical protein